MVKSLLVFISISSLIFIAEWQIIRSPDGMLQFQTPTEMHYSRDKALTSIGPIQLHIYQSLDKDTLQNKYKVTYYELPIYLNMESDSMFNEMAGQITQSMLEYPGATLDYTQPGQYKDGYQMTSRVTYNDHYVAKSIIQSNGTHLVNAQCFVPKSMSLNYNVDQFLSKVILHPISVSK